MTEGPRLWLDLLLVSAAAWLAFFARRLSDGADQRLTWRRIALETPGAVACGLVGGGICHLLGATEPMVLAGAGAVSGHLGMTALLDLAARVVPRPPPPP